jgi:hypothetical protein
MEPEYAAVRGGIERVERQPGGAPGFHLTGGVDLDLPSWRQPEMRFSAGAGHRQSDQTGDRIGASLRLWPAQTLENLAVMPAGATDGDACSRARCALR